MICGIGVDVIEVVRIAEAEKRHGERFLRRIYTQLEMEKVHGNRHQYFAARFAAKEASFKALGTGWSGGVRWLDVEVDNLSSGRPVLALTGVARARADDLGVTLLHISLSHTSGLAVAQVVLEGLPPTGASNSDRKEKA